MATRSLVEETRMHILVAYASRHGATQGIAERIAETLRSAGLDAEALRSHPSRAWPGTTPS